MDLYGVKSEQSNNLGNEDMLEMALRIAQEINEEPQLDLEDTIQSTINPAGKYFTSVSKCTMNHYIHDCRNIFQRPILI